MQGDWKPVLFPLSTTEVQQASFSTRHLTSPVVVLKCNVSLDLSEKQHILENAFPAMLTWTFWYSLEVQLSELDAEAGGIGINPQFLGPKQEGEQRQLRMK